MKLFKCDNCSEFYIPRNEDKPDMTFHKGLKFELTIIAYRAEKVCEGAELCQKCVKEIISTSPASLTPEAP